MRRSLTIATLVVRAVRNLARVDLQAGPRFNVVAGDNGQGKTNLLEAVYVLATSKSFRSSKPGELIAFGAASASVRGVVLEAGDAREQMIGLSPGLRNARLDGKRPPSLVAYAVRTPAVVFHSGELALSTGSGGERRRLLDRLGLYLDPGATDELASYTRALRERQRALDTRGVGAGDLDQWEELIVKHGLTVMASRREAAGRLARAAVVAFDQIALPGGELDVSYRPSAPQEAAVYAATLRANRWLDARRRAAKVGPHRDELFLGLGGRPVRGIASQGQHRAVVLALKSAEIEVIADARGVMPLLLLDDVSSELDRARTAALFASLQRQQGQVFLTTTRPELIDTGTVANGGDRVDFRVSGGVVTRA